MNSSRFPAMCLLLCCTACGDSPLAPDRLGATQVSDQALLVSILTKLDSIEVKMDRQSWALAVLDSTLASARQDPGNGNGLGPMLGVPQQLRELQEGHLTLLDRIGTLTVGVGLPAPPEINMSPSELFQKSSKVCLTLGTRGSAGLAGEFKVLFKAEGGLGIDFYGNNLTVDLRGQAEIKPKATWDILHGGVNYTFCVNAGRDEAQALMAALPFNSDEFFTRYTTLANDMQTLRTNPFNLINPSFRLFGMTGYPDPQTALNRIDQFFGGIRGGLCTKLKTDFDINTRLGLAGGNLLGGVFNSPVSNLQNRFGSNC